MSNNQNPWRDFGEMQFFCLNFLAVRSRAVDNSRTKGRVVKLADTQDLGSCGAILAGSNPASPTNIAGHFCPDAAIRPRLHKRSRP